MEKQIVGVVGAGVMGVGVAQNLAQTRDKVFLLELTEDILDRASEEMRRNLRLQRMMSKERAQMSDAEIMDHITFTTDYAPFAGADFVVENVIETWEAKREVHARL